MRVYLVGCLVLASLSMGCGPTSQTEPIEETATSEPAVSEESSSPEADSGGSEPTTSASNELEFGRIKLKAPEGWFDLEVLDAIVEVAPAPLVDPPCLVDQLRA